jgi:hypothetical protein
MFWLIILNFCHSRDLFSGKPYVFTGHTTYGFGAIRASRQSRRYDQNDILIFGGTGFHEDFTESGNQVFHFWPYLANSVKGLLGVGEAFAANAYHEVYEGLIPQKSENGTGYDVQHNGSSADYALSSVAIGIGLRVQLGTLSIDELPKYLRIRLGPEGPGSHGFVQTTENTLPLPLLPSSGSPNFGY